MTTDAEASAALQAENDRLRQRVAELERQAEGLGEQAEMFTQALDAVGDQVLIKGPRSHIVYANKAFRDLYGMTMDQLRNMIDAPFNEPDYTQQYIKDDEYVFSTGQILEIPREYVTRHDGSVRTARTVKSPIRNAAGQVVKTVGISRDITESAHAEDLVSRLAAILEATTDFVMMADLQGHALYLNRAGRGLVGIPADADIGAYTIADFQPDSMLAAQAIPTAMRAGVWSGEATIRRHDGGAIPVSQVILAHRAADGSPEFLSTVARDMSALKRAEEALRQSMLQEEIIRGQAAALAELSTPLIPISSKIVVMPLIGTMDSRRAQQVIETLLKGIAASGAQTAILDITGVAVVDTQVANALVRAAHAVQLLGAQVVLTGIRPEVAHTLVGLGADLGGIVTRGSLQSGIAYAVGSDKSAFFA